MIRISTIFVALCMVLIATSLGLVLHTMAGFNSLEAGVIALVTLAFLLLYNAVSMRLYNRADAGGQIADLSRGTADLARQFAEFGRRLAAVEQRTAALDSTSQERVQTALGEINELGTMVKQLAVSIAAHDEVLAEMLDGRPPAPAADVPPARDNGLARDNGTARAAQPPAPPPHASQPSASQTARFVNDLEWVDAPTVPPIPREAPAPLLQTPTRPAPAAAPARGPMHAAVKKAIETNRIEVYLQPLVTLPQRKVRFYEAVSRIRDDNDQLIAAHDFIAAAEADGLMGQIDRMVLLRCVQVLRRLLVRNKDVGLFCNVSSATLGNPAAFAQCLDFLDANRVLAPSFVLEFKQTTLRNLGPVESENLAALAQRGYRFSVDHVSDLRIEPRELADRGVRFIKVPAQLLLDQKQMSAADIHPADLSDLLGRFGIDLVAERIEGERSVVDLLDYDIRFGQGYLFAPPRPLRPENASPGTNTGHEVANSDVTGTDPARTASPRFTGNAALARRVAGPN
jgi:cyclic-di-GMP phosphodiesterase, flagellum assembly factor TipF